VPTLTAAHRRDLAELTGLAQNDLTLIWREFNTATVARDGLIEVLPRLVSIYGSAASTLGADWYDEMRAAAKVKGRFRAIPAELPDIGRTDALARWGVSPLFQAESDFASALTLVGGGLQRIIADTDRQSVIGSLRDDPQAAGWERETAGGCDFCVMLAGRGAVYSADTADFSSHDHCRCTAVPIFGEGHEVRESTDWRPSGARDGTPERVTDWDATQTTGQLRKTLAELEASAAKFETAGTRARIEDLRRKIAAR